MRFFIVFAFTKPFTILAPCRWLWSTANFFVYLIIYNSHAFNAGEKMSILKQGSHQIITLNSSRYLKTGSTLIFC